MAANSNGSGISERRHGLHELAHQIMCLRMEFHDVREKIDNRIICLEGWRAETDPVLKMIVRTMWMLRGAAVILVTATAIVVWIWLQDHLMLTEVSRLVITNTALISQMQKVDDGHESDIQKLRDSLGH